GVRRQRDDPRGPVAVLDPGDLRRRDPRRCQRGRADRTADPAARRGEADPVSAAGRLRGLARWETLLVVVLIGLIVLGNRLSPVFLPPRNFANLLAALMEVAIMAVPMTLVIIPGESVP